jgi:hypothetical protein
MEIERLRARVAELEAQEPVAWMHETRVDVIHDSVKTLLKTLSEGAGPESLHRPIDKSERYTIPLYAGPVPAAQAVAGQHADDVAVDRFAEAMKAKMAASRAKGRGGWESTEVCPPGSLQLMMLEHIAKGDPVDVGNFAMMIFNRGETTAAAQPVAVAVPDGYVIVPVEPTDAMCEAADKIWRQIGIIDPTMHVWDAMLAASQQAKEVQSE